MNLLSETIRAGFAGKRVVIVGDLVADQFLRGTIARVSREAPVFILRHDETETSAGGAANAAVNVAALGGDPVLIGLTGNDDNGRLLRRVLEKASVDCRYIVSADSIKTTTKVRVLAGQHYAARQQVIRIDYEDRAPITEEIRGQLVDNLISASDGADVFIVSDYNYGVAEPVIYERLRGLSKDKNIPLLIDSRFRLREFPNATSATPNQEEVEQILGKDCSEADYARLCKELSFESLLITRGNKGMILIDKDNTVKIMDAVGPAEPVDVTGAGDTVIAAYALGVASGLSFFDAATIANQAGGLAVMKKGTASVTAAELLESISSNTKFTDSAKR